MDVSRRSDCGHSKILVRLLDMQGRWMKVDCLNQNGQV